MEVWYKKRPDILQEEINSLSSRNIGFQKDKQALQENKLRLACSIPRGTFGIDIGEDLIVAIQFPDNYPYFRPEVALLNYSLPRHQHPSGKNLCLIPRPTQFWNLETIGEFLESRLPLVLVKGQITDQAAIALDPDEQAEPVSEYFINQSKVTVISDRPILFTRPLSFESKDFKILEQGFLDLIYPENCRNISILWNKDNIEESLSNNLNFKIKRWLDAKGNFLGKDFPFHHKDHRQTRTRWYLLNKFPPFVNEREGFEKFYTELQQQSIPLPKALAIKTKDFTFDYLIGLIFPEEEFKGKIGWGWMFLSSGKSYISSKRRGNSYLKYQFNLPVQSIAEEDLKMRIPASSGFKNKTISVVGLGTLGALSAIEMAKNGVGKLILMDYDNVETTSGVRWPLGYKYVGQQKTVALKTFLNENFPNVEVEILIQKIGSLQDIYQNENEKIEKFLETNFVYDSSAEEGVNHFLSVLCRERKTPYLLIEGRLGGWGGIIARFLPDKSKGCWMCFKYSLLDNTITPPPQDITGGIQPKGCGDISFTGSSFDMSNISLAGVKLLSQTLNETELSYDIGVLSLVDKNEKSILPKWDSYDLQIHPECPYCHENSLDKE